MTRWDDLALMLHRVPVVGILRGCPLEHAVAIGRAAVGAGIPVLEVTLDSPSPGDAIRSLAGALPDAVVGAGTVRSLGDLDLAEEAGAAFIVTPLLSLPVVTEAVRRGLPCIPGASTPSEIWSALEAGADAVKVFPVRELGGPEYLRAIRDPLGDPPLVPTGGVGPADAAAYLAAGALALGVGGSVFPRDALTRGDAVRVGSLAAELVGSLR